MHLIEAYYTKIIHSVDAESVSKLNLMLANNDAQLLCLKTSRCCFIFHFPIAKSS